MKSHGPKHRQTCSLVHAFPIFFSCVHVVKVYAGNPTFLWCYFIYILFSAQPLFEPQPVCVRLPPPAAQQTERRVSPDFSTCCLSFLCSPLRFTFICSDLLLSSCYCCIKNSRWRQPFLVQLI